jgi:hypothetical protein
MKIIASLAGLMRVTRAADGSATTIKGSMKPEMRPVASWQEEMVYQV